VFAMSAPVYSHFVEERVSKLTCERPNPDSVFDSAPCSPHGYKLMAANSSGEL
jgi:hypothetical protein